MGSEDTEALDAQQEILDHLIDLISCSQNLKQFKQVLAQLDPKLINEWHSITRLSPLETLLSCYPRLTEIDFNFLERLLDLKADLRKVDQVTLKRVMEARNEEANEMLRKFRIRLAEESIRLDWSTTTRKREFDVVEGDRGTLRNVAQSRSPSPLSPTLAYRQASLKTDSWTPSPRRSNNPTPPPYSEAQSHNLYSRASSSTLSSSPAPPSNRMPPSFIRPLRPRPSHRPHPSETIKLWMPLPLHCNSSLIESYFNEILGVEIFDLNLYVKRLPCFGFITVLKSIWLNSNSEGSGSGSGSGLLSRERIRELEKFEPFRDYYGKSWLVRLNVSRDELWKLDHHHQRKEEITSPPPPASSQVRRFSRDGSNSRFNELEEMDNRVERASIDEERTNEERCEPPQIDEEEKVFDSQVEQGINHLPDNDNEFDKKFTGDEQEEVVEQVEVESLEWIPLSIRGFPSKTSRAQIVQTLKKFLKFWSDFNIFIERDSTSGKLGSVVKLSVRGESVARKAEKLIQRVHVEGTKLKVRRENEYGVTTEMQQIMESTKGYLEEGELEESETIVDVEGVDVRQPDPAHSGQVYSSPRKRGRSSSRRDSRGRSSSKDDSRSRSPQRRRMEGKNGGDVGGISDSRPLAYGLEEREPGEIERDEKWINYRQRSRSTDEFGRAYRFSPSTNLYSSLPPPPCIQSFHQSPYYDYNPYDRLSSTPPPPPMFTTFKRLTSPTPEYYLDYRSPETTIPERRSIPATIYPPPSPSASTFRPSLHLEPPTIPTPPPAPVRAKESPEETTYPRLADSICYRFPRPRRKPDPSQQQNSENSNLRRRRLPLPPQSHCFYETLPAPDQSFESIGVGGTGAIPRILTSEEIKQEEKDERDGLKLSDRVQYGGSGRRQEM